MAEIICAGFGGQGVLVAGMILAHAGMESGRHVTWYPSYGSEMRGGTANCNVIISEEEIASPYVKHLDILLAMNEVSINKFEHLIKPGGLLVVNTSLAKPDHVYPSDIKVAKVPANEIAEKAGNPRGVNIAMLGGMAASCDLFEQDYMRQAIVDYFAKKGKVNPRNVECFDCGAEAAGREG